MAGSGAAQKRCAPAAQAAESEAAESEADLASKRARAAVDTAQGTPDGGGNMAKVVQDSEVKEDSLRTVEAFTRDFDAEAYARMTDDAPRVAAYARAISRAGVAGKVVLDIGTGPHALLARLAVDAGAARVVAVEALPLVAKKAREAVASAGLADRIEVLDGHSALLQLPRVDIVVHEIVGDIATEEAVAACLADLQRRHDVVDSGRPGWSLPCRIETICAPTSLRVASPVDAAEEEDVTELPEGVCDEESASDEAGPGGGQVVRLPFAPPASTILGEPQVMEVVDADREIELLQERVLTWHMAAPATLTGIACAPRIHLDAAGEQIDNWTGSFHWRHVLVLLDTAVLVEKGDEIRLRVRSDLRHFPVHHVFSMSILRFDAGATSVGEPEELGTVEVTLDGASAEPSVGTSAPS